MIDPGRDAYRGFEYQIAVSVWLLLEFATDDSGCVVQVEPMGGEDLEILRDENLDADTGAQPVRLEIETASLGRYLVQVKARRVGAWTASEMDAVLGTGDENCSGGRVRPLVMLESDATTRFLFVTNATLGTGLGDLAVDRANFVSNVVVDALHSTVLANRGLQLVRRVGVLQQEKLELVKQHAFDLLRIKLHVPFSKRQQAYAVLREKVRAGMLSRTEACIDRAFVDKVAKENGGLPANPRRFVEPSQMARFREWLDTQFGLFLVGEPGGGKTTLAEQLLYEHRIRPEPFEPFSPSSPRDLRALPNASDRILVYVEDPFGRYQPADDAVEWRRELEDFAARTHADRILLVTSRTAFAKPLLTGDDAPSLSRLCADFGTHQFRKKQRLELLQKHLTEAPMLSQPVKDWVLEHSDTVVTSLRRPLSYSRLPQELAKLNSSNLSRKNLLECVQSARDAEAGLDLESTFAGRSERHLRGLGAIWLATEAWSRIDFRSGLGARVDFVGKILVEAAVAAEVSGVWRELVERMWVEPRDDGYAVHPTYVDAMGRVMRKSASLLGEVVEPVFTALLATGDLSAVATVWRAVQGRVTMRDALTGKALAAARTTLVVSCAENAPAAKFGTALRYLSEFGAPDAPLDALAIALESTRGRDPQHGMLFDSLAWHLPVWPEELERRIRENQDVPLVVKAFVRHLPFRGTAVVSGAKRIVGFLYSLVDVSAEFDATINYLEDRGHFETEVMARGIVRSINSDPGQLVARAVALARDAQEWFDSLSDVDEDSDGYLEHLGEIHYQMMKPAETLIDALLDAKIADNDSAWIARRTEPLVFARLANGNRVSKLDACSLKLIVEAAPADEAAAIANAAMKLEQLRDATLMLVPSLEPHFWPNLAAQAVLDEFGSGRFSEERATRVWKTVEEPLSALKPFERVALAHELIASTPEMAGRLDSIMSDEERLACKQLVGVPPPIDVRSELLIRTLAASPWQAAVPAVRRLGTLELVDSTLLLSILDSSVNHALAAIEAANSLRDASRFAVASKGVVHKEGAVRRLAAGLLPSIEDERVSDLARNLSIDPTPSVRIALANATRGCGRGEMLMVLLDMLTDKTDTSDAARSGYWLDGAKPERGVSRAAGSALIATSDWPLAVVEGLNRINLREVADAWTRKALGNEIQRRAVLSV